MDEHRIAIRRRTFLKGRIEFNNRQASVECVVRDLSETGARITISDNVMVPNNFDLYLPHKDETLSCSLSWRRSGEIGVRFVEAVAMLDPDLGIPLDVARKMKELEAEVAKLRRLVEQIKAHPENASVLVGNNVF